MFAGLIVCALIVSGLSTVLLDLTSRSGADETSLDVDQPSAFERQLRQEVERRPQDPEPMVQLANFLGVMGETDEAITIYERALALAPDNVGYRLEFAESLAAENRLADAEIQFRTAQSLEPTNAQASFGLGEIYRRWQPPRIDEAVAAYERTARLAPTSLPGQQATKELARLSRPVATPGSSPVSSPGP